MKWCPAITRDELDLILLGQIFAHICDEEEIVPCSSNNPSFRRRAHVSFYHHRWPICKNTWMKLHGTGMQQWKVVIVYTWILCRQGSIHQCKVSQQESMETPNGDPTMHSHLSRQGMWCGIFVATQTIMRYFYLEEYQDTKETTSSCFPLLPPRKWTHSHLKLEKDGRKCYKDQISKCKEGVNTTFTISVIPLPFSRVHRMSPFTQFWHGTTRKSS